MRISENSRKKHKCADEREVEKKMKKKEKKEEEKKKKKKSPDPASKRLDSEPKRNKLLHELVAVVHRSPLPSRSSLLSLRTDATPPLAVECAGRPAGTKIHI